MSEAPASSASKPAVNAIVAWGALVLIFASAVSLAAVHAPPRVKLLVLFPIAQAVLIGWIAARIASATGTRFQSNWFPALLIAGVIAAGQLGTALESHRLRLAALQSQSRLKPDEAFAAHMLEEAQKHDDPKAKEFARDLGDALDRTVGEHQRRIAEQATFQGYLSHRASALGDWRRPWPSIFWMAESFAAAVCGALVFRRFAPLDDVRIDR